MHRAAPTLRPCPLRPEILNLLESGSGHWSQWSSGTAGNLPSGQLRDAFHREVPSLRSHCKLLLGFGACSRWHSSLKLPGGKGPAHWEGAPSVSTWVLLKSKMRTLKEPNKMSPLKLGRETPSFPIIKDDLEEIVHQYVRHVMVYTGLYGADPWILSTVYSINSVGSIFRVPK